MMCRRLRLATTCLLLGAACLAGCDSQGSGSGACASGDPACAHPGRDAGRNLDVAAGSDAAAEEATAGSDAADSSPADTALDLEGDAPDGTPSRNGGLVPEPDAIFLSTAGIGTLQEQIVRVWNQSDQTVVFHSVTIDSDAPGFSLREAPSEVSREPGQAIGFAMDYTAQSNDDVTATIIVEHSLGDPLLIPVTVASKVGESACIHVAPTSLDFGSQVRGTGSSTRTFQIQNCGAADIRVLRLDRGRVLGLLPTPDSFQWTSDPLPLTLAASATTDVTVTYTAGRAGEDLGTIDVVSNVTGSEVTHVSLHGESQVPPIEDLDVHLVLTWDVAGGSDVDFHFLPDSSDLFSCDDCFYSNMSPDWGVAGDILDDPFLDRDDLEGPGPENINVSQLQPGTYLIAVHYYSDTGSSGSGDFNTPTPTNATVQVYLGGVLAATYGPQLLDQTDRTWYVARLDWPSGTLTPIGTTEIINRSDYSWCFGGF